MNMFTNRSACLTLPPCVYGYGSLKSEAGLRVCESVVELTLLSFSPDSLSLSLSLSVVFFSTIISWLRLPFSYSLAFRHVCLSTYLSGCLPVCLFLASNVKSLLRLEQLTNCAVSSQSINYNSLLKIHKDAIRNVGL